MSDQKWAFLKLTCVEYPQGWCLTLLFVFLSFFLSFFLSSFPYFYLNLTFCFEDDHFGHFLAYVSLIPFAIVVSLVTVLFTNRELSAVS